MTVHDIEKRRISSLLSMQPSDSIRVKVVLEAMLAGQMIDLGGEYTPLPDGRTVWKFDWTWDLENKTLDDLAKMLFPDWADCRRGSGI